jgi:hypothetical protein
LLRDKTNSSHFNTYALNVRENVERVSKTLEANYREGIDAISLSGTRKMFSKFDFALNTGLPIISPVEPVFFAFVGKMSAIYDYDLLPSKSGDAEFQRYITDLAKTWRKIEASFNGMFIPRLNSLSYKDKEYNQTGITFTPPFARRSLLDNTVIPYGSILVIASATGKDIEKLSALSASSSGSYLTLPDSPQEIKLPHVPSSVWGNPNIIAVLARGGLGSIWQALIDQKPIGLVNTPPEDDPEIFHNANTVQWAGIGTILEENVMPLIGALPQYLSAIQKQLNLEKQEFGTIDGFEFTIAQLKQMLT